MLHFQSFSWATDIPAFINKNGFNLISIVDKGDGHVIAFFEDYQLTGGLRQDIQTIIGRFDKGPQLYKTSATFNMVIQSIARGVDPYKIIEQLAQTVDSATLSLIHQMNK